MKLKKNPIPRFADLPILRCWPILVFIIAVVISVIAFAPTLSAYSVLQAPDGMPTFARVGLFRRFIPLCSEQPVFPIFDDLLRLLPPLIRHEWCYIISTALLAVAGAAYMRAIGLPLFASCAGGLTLAFSGYNWTLFNAGHGGIFFAMPYIVFAFAIAERLFRAPRWFHFALIPLCFTAGITIQADITILFGLLYAAYLVFRFILAARTEGFKPYFARTSRAFAFGIPLALVIGAIACAPALKRLFTEVAADRNKQIEQSVEAAAKNSETESDPENAAWIFATNWSLPPEDCLEFIAPTLRGLDTASRDAPYWGRLGRTYGWEKSKQGFFNYRQHSVYLGAASCAFAIFGLVTTLAFFPIRKRPTAEPKKTVNPSPFTLNLFWATVFLIALLLAFGRHTPFYNAFYALPFMDKIRAPVKFLHICELALSVLFAGGIASLMQTNVARQPRFKISAIVSIAIISGIAILCLALAFIFPVESKTEFWSSIGIAGKTPDTLVALWKGSLIRAFIILALCAGAIGLRLIDGAEKYAKIAAAAIALIAVFDLAESGSRFVVPLDYSHKKTPSIVAEALAQNGADIHGSSYSYIFLAKQILPPSVPFMDALADGENYHLYSAEPVQGDTAESPRVLIYSAFGNDIFRRFAFQGVQAIFAPVDLATDMSRRGNAKIVSSFDITKNNMLVPARNPQTPQVVLLRPTATLPTASVFHSWQSADTATNAVALAAARGFDIANTAVITSTNFVARSSPRPRSAAVWEESPLSNGGRRAILSADTEEEGLLVYSPVMLGGALKVRATVNGVPAPIHTANLMWRAVPVPAGKSTVEIRPVTNPSSAVFAIAFAMLFVFCLFLYCRER